MFSERLSLKIIFKPARFFTSMTTAQKVLC